MKPILFSTPMVQAILYGRKTMTRRIFTKKQAELFKYAIMAGELKSTLEDYNNEHWLWAKYRIGDVLWVRETWGVHGINKRIVYKATEWLNNDAPLSHKWKPSIFMPKEACRIFLRVTNVRVERLQDISVEDIKKEGAPLITITGNNEDFINSKLKGWWYDLWNSINGKGAWEENPFVFVYEFQRVEKPKEMK